MATYCVQFFFGRRYNLQPLSPWTRDPCHGSTFAIRESEKYGMKEDTIYPSVVPRTSAPFSSFRWVYRPVRWLVSGLVWADWCWFVVREKYCLLAGLSWLKPISEHAV